MSIDEIWKPIIGFDGKYDVSNLGNVRNATRGNILKPNKNMFGYAQYCLRMNGKGHSKRGHRLVAEAFIPNPNELPQVNHIDGNKMNNKVDNLEWVTDKENVQHALANGLRKTVSVRIIETGQIFESMDACAKAINGSIGDVLRCVKGITKTHKGYHIERY